MATLSQLQTWLSEAETARHTLAMGERVASVMRAGRKMDFTAANLDDLENYIRTLERDIAAAEAAAAGRPRRSAIQVGQWRD